VPMQTTPRLTEAERCVRCHAVAPDPASPEFLEWDPVGDEDSVICPRCLTEAEEHALVRPSSPYATHNRYG
jgi:hypothetical protein